MAQHDQNIANDTGAAVRADINNALGALFSVSSGGTAPATTIAYMLWSDTAAGLLKQRNAANTGWLVRGTLAETFFISRAANTILAAADHGRSFAATANFTQTLTAAATLGDGWFLAYRVDSGVTTTFDPNGAETIDGAATKVVVGPSAGLIFCSGSAFFTYGFDNPVASDTVQGVIEIATQAEQETGSDTGRAVTPARQHFHPSAAKAWVRFSGVTQVIVSSYNVTSVARSGTGTYQINFTTAFSDANYCCVGSAGSGGIGNGTTVALESGTTIQATVQATAGGPNASVDPTNISLVFYGDM